jgi:hypothetical protein
MKVESVIVPRKPASPTDDLPIMNAEEIKTILYLGIRGAVELETDKKHSVDMLA